MGSEAFPREDRLRERRDYLRCYRQGRRRTRALLMLYSIPNDLGRPRLGITASRKVGSAVIRNRLKRRVRDIFRRFPDRGALGGVDLVVHLQPQSGRSSFDELRAELGGLLSGAVREARRSES